MLEEFTPCIRALAPCPPHAVARPVQPKTLTYCNQAASKLVQKQKKLHFVDAAALDNVPSLEVPKQFDTPVMHLAIDSYINAI